MLRRKVVEFIKAESKGIEPSDLAMELSAIAVILVGSMAKIAAKRQDEYLDIVIKSLEELKELK